MKTFIGIVIGLAIATGLYLFLRGTAASAGPNGGDVVSLQDGAANAELLANADTGGLMVHTWDKDLKHPHPIKSEPFTVGSGQQTVELAPDPVAGDPAGFSSRFSGQADWARGGGVHQGWMHQSGQVGDHHEFAWNRCWNAGQAHSSMWMGMGANRKMGESAGPRGMSGGMHNGPNH